MEISTRSEASASQAIAPRTENESRLCEFIENEAESLLGILRYYVSRSGLAAGDLVREIALELMSEVVVEALEHADRFDSSRSPRAWLLGIGANLIKRKQAQKRIRGEREPLVRDLYDDTRDSLSDDELFYLVAAAADEGPAQDLEAVEQAKAMLALVSETDQEVLRLAVLHSFDCRSIAQILGIKPGAARVRLHRALNRLRDAWLTKGDTVGSGRRMK